MKIPEIVLRVPLLSLMLACLYGAHSETSYTWRLDMDIGKVLPSSHMPHSESLSKEAVKQDEVQEVMLDILMSTVTNTEGIWKKTSHESYCSQCERPGGASKRRNNRGIVEQENALEEEEDEEKFKNEVLDCGKPVNFTYYDHLLSLQNRQTLPHLPEPEVALTFRSKKSAKKTSGEVNIDNIERKLKKSKREKPKSVELYNQIGNFWRIKGDTQKSVECFRRALAVSPNNAEILLNLARVLFNLQYLDDAIFLTRRSLEVQPPDQNAWLQHFQLGEILKAYCHYQEAALHLRHVLELKPNYAPALAALKEMESLPDTSLHGYTIIIIVFLVMGVLLWIASTFDSPGGSEDKDTNGGVKSRLHLAKMKLHMKNKRFL